MREIKFRGFNPATQEIVSWEGIQGWSMGGLGSPNIMQYTGLKDINDKEIYEGDIVKGKHLIGEWIAKVDMLPTGVWYGGARFTEVATPEIIGNIYENPDLLK